MNKLILLLGMLICNFGCDSVPKDDIQTEQNAAKNLLNCYDQQIKITYFGDAFTTVRSNQPFRRYEGCNKIIHCTNSYGGNLSCFRID